VYPTHAEWNDNEHWLFEDHTAKNPEKKSVLFSKKMRILKILIFEKITDFFLTIFPSAAHGPESIEYSLKNSRKYYNNILI